MRQITFFVATRKVGSRMEHTEEFPDETDDAEIEEYYENWVWEQLNAGWKEET